MMSYKRAAITGQSVQKVKFQGHINIGHVITFLHLVYSRTRGLVDSITNIQCDTSSDSDFTSFVHPEDTKTPVVISAGHSLGHIYNLFYYSTNYSHIVPQLNAAKHRFEVCKTWHFPRVSYN